MVVVRSLSISSSGTVTGSCFLLRKIYFMIHIHPPLPGMDLLSLSLSHRYLYIPPSESCFRKSKKKSISETSTPTEVVRMMNELEEHRAQIITALFGAPEMQSKNHQRFCMEV